MRGLKFLVIFMGILIIVGTSFLVFTIIKRGSDMVVSQNEKEYKPFIEIDSPKNMELNKVFYDSKKIILKYENVEKYIIQIIDMNSGEVLKQININK